MAKEGNGVEAGAAAQQQMQQQFFQRRLQTGLNMLWPVACCQVYSSIFKYIQDRACVFSLPRYLQRNDRTRGRPLASGRRSACSAKPRGFCVVRHIESVRFVRPRRLCSCSTRILPQKNDPGKQITPAMEANQRPRQWRRTKVFEKQVGLYISDPSAPSTDIVTCGTYSGKSADKHTGGAGDSRPKWCRLILQSYSSCTRTPICYIV